MRLLILYSELAGYVNECLEIASSQHEVMVVHWPVKSEAPFDLDAYSFIRKEKNERMQLDQTISDFSPDLIICSGWIDSDYITAIKNYNSHAPCVLILDNQFKKSVRQLLGGLYARVKIKPLFNYAWVPGATQMEFANYLGFNKDEIIQGFYTADEKRFLIEKSKFEKSVPQVFIFAGRYINHKGIFDLWSAYEKYRKLGGTWELWCIGTGEEYSNRKEIPGLKHFGFLQPAELAAMLPKASVYILPSHFEPWGVSVHEFALGGFPMILSSSVGSASAFLEDGKNGIIVPPKSSEKLMEAMLDISQQTNGELQKMSERSVELGQKINQKNWMETLESFVA